MHLSDGINGRGTQQQLVREKGRGQSFDDDAGNVQQYYNTHTKQHLQQNYLKNGRKKASEIIKLLRMVSRNVGKIIGCAQLVKLNEQIKMRYDRTCTMY